jgi:hypothetical protein
MNFAYFYSAVKTWTSYICLNIDVDNKFKLKKEQFEKEFKKLKKLLKKNLNIKLFISESTNGNGYHLHFKLLLTENDWHEPENDGFKQLNEYEMQCKLRKRILKFQKELRIAVIKNKILLHVDLMGLPAIYLENQIVSRGTWILYPKNIENPTVMKQFQKRGTARLYQLDCFAPQGEAVEVLPPQQNKFQGDSFSFGSQSQSVDFVLAKTITKELNQLTAQSNKLDNRREWTNSIQGGIYFAVMKSCSDEQDKKKDEYKNTIPAKMIEARINQMQTKGVIDFRFNYKVFLYWRDFMSLHGIVEVIDETYRIGEEVIDQYGEITKQGGVAMKWKVITSSFYREEEHILSGTKQLTINPKWRGIAVQIGGYTIINQYNTEKEVLQTIFELAT